MNTHKQLMYELKQFFYENQYDEERYPHFRCCDMEFEYDMYGEKHIYFIFFN